MTQQAIDFVIKTFALTFALVFGMMALTIFAAVFVLGDGEAQHIISDMTAPFIAIAGSFVTAFLGHWFFVLRQAGSPTGTPNSAYNAQIAQGSRYVAPQWPPNGAKGGGYQSAPQGPLSPPSAAQAATQAQEGVGNAHQGEL